MKPRSKNVLVVVAWVVGVIGLVIATLPRERGRKSLESIENKSVQPSAIQLIKAGFTAMERSQTDKSAALAAEVLFSRARQMDPDNPQILFGLAWAKARRGAAPTESTSLYKRSASEGIKWASWSFFNMAQAERRAGHHAAALKHYQRACQLRPEDHECWYAIGVESLAVGQARQALRAFQRTLQLREKQPWAYYQQGRAFHALGEIERREQSWAKALKLKPELNRQITRIKTKPIPGVVPAKRIPKPEQNRR